MPDIGKGVREIRNRTSDGAFRVFYVVESATDVYVLHAFRKKTQKTSRQDMEKGKARYKLVPYCRKRGAPYPSIPVMKTGSQNPPATCSPTWDSMTPKHRSWRCARISWRC